MEARTPRSDGNHGHKLNYKSVGKHCLSLMYTEFCHSGSLTIIVTRSFNSLEDLKVKVDIKEYEV